VFFDRCSYLFAILERKIAGFMQATMITAHDKKVEKRT